MIIDFSKINYTEKPVLILKNLNGTSIQTLGYAFNIQGEFLYNEISTLTFELPYKVNNILTPHYNDVVGMRIIDLHNVGQFILADPIEEIQEGKRIKSCKAYSLEYEFTKKNITLESGTYNFWNSLDPNDTIIGRILEKMPGWSIGEIDQSLIGKYRTFEISTEKIYNFIKSEVQEKYGCIFDFDTYKREINVVSVETEVSTQPIYLSKNKLLKKIQIEEDSDSIVTALDVSGAEGVTIRSVNPTGSNTIYNLDYFMNSTNFSEDFIEKWHKWEQTYANYQSIYYNTTIEYNLKTASKLTKQAALTDLKNELIDLENQQAVIVQAIAQNLSSTSELNDKKDEINDKKDDIDEVESQISRLDNEIDELFETLSNINSILAFDSIDSSGEYRYFTPDEVLILQKYFIEDSVQDRTFAISDTGSYNNTDISSKIDNVELHIANADINEIAIDNKLIYTIAEGRLEISTLATDIIKASIEFNDDETFVLTATLGDGIVGDTTFNSGNISIIGDYFTMTNSSRTLSFGILNGTLYFTKNSTEFEKHSVEWDLYEYGKQILKEKASPTYNFSVDSGNFLSIDDYISFKNSLTLGERIYLKLDDTEILTPYVISAKVNYEDASDFKLEFSSSYTTYDKQFQLAKLLDQSISMGKQLSIKSNIYNEFVNSGASTKVKTFMNSALDVAKNAVLSSGKQAIEFGDAGIRVRKWASEDHTTFDDEQIWIVDNMIAFTKDNWSTSNMAIGKIFDENLGGYTKASQIYDSSKTYYHRVGEASPYVYIPYIYDEATWEDEYSNLYYKSGGYAYGIAAPYLVGTILAGESLTISTDNGAFRVDESGVYIDALKFYITHNGSSYDTTLNGEIEKIEAISSFMTDDKSYLNASKLAGIIDSTNTQMRSAIGNVLFDSDGIWLMNGTTKNSSTQAIWMNERGILFGEGEKTNNPSSSDSGWEWTTAINHEGIVAEALAGKTISGIHLSASDINIGDGNFVVTKNGSLTATRGEFSGKIQASDFLDKNGNSMMNDNYQFEPDYLSLHGLTISNDDGDETLSIDKNGNIFLSGSITLGAGSVIDWSEIDETESDSYNTAIAIADGNYSDGSFISKNIIKSPQIIGGEIRGGLFCDENKRASLDLSTSNEIADLTYTKIYADGDTRELFQIRDGGLDAAIRLGNQEIGVVNYTNKHFYPSGIWDFSSGNLTVTGLKITFG